MPYPPSNPAVSGLLVMMRIVPGLRARAVQRALRTRQRFDARDVVHVDVERALDRGDGLLVEILADARLRTGVVAVVAGSPRRA